MHSSTLLLAAASAVSVLGAPVVERANFDALPGGDIDILNYALTLEYLERFFYKQGLANYSEAAFVSAGYDATFYKNLQEVYQDEADHVDFLATALGDKAVKEATYAFPSTDVASFVALAAVLEGVGVSAYLGAAGVIMDKAYITPAGSILAIEARHAAYLRAAGAGLSPFPKAFDTPLNFNQVYSLAAQFITGFAPGTVLPFMAFPPIVVEPLLPTLGRRTSHPKHPKPAPAAYKEADCGVIFKGAYANAAHAKLIGDYEDVYAVFFSGLDVYYVKTVRKGDDLVAELLPAGAVGQVYIVLSKADGTAAKVADENTISGVGIIEVLAA